MNQSLTSAQFMYLWEATNLDTMPHPFEHRTAARVESELHAERDRLERWSAEEAHPRLRDAVAVLRHPDVSVSVFSQDDAPILRRGAVRGRCAVVAEQLTGTDRTGDLRLQVRVGPRSPDVSQFVGALLRDIPAGPPGRNTAVDAHRDDIRSGSGGGGVLRSATVSGADLFKRIVARRTAAGHVCVHGPWQGPRDTILDSITWLDIADDGRYLYYTDHLMRLRSATAADLEGHLERRVRAALAR